MKPEKRLKPAARRRSADGFNDGILIRPCHGIEEFQAEVLPQQKGEAVKRLREGEPSIELRPGAKDGLEVAVWMLQPGEAQIVAKRIREVLKGG